MSLKAKLEAVIYAAEEPVTVAQLAGLFTEEALEWKPKAAEPDAMSTDERVERDDAGESEPEADAIEAVGKTFVDENAVAEMPVETEVLAEDLAALEAEAKRLTRLREREARDAIRALLGELVGEYAAEDRGVEIREIAGGYRMATKPEYHDAVRQFVKSQKPPLKLSLPALETLAVIAYKQPVTAPEVNEIRGVDSSGVFGSLLARKLIATAGRKQVIGRPILYKTTREFLLRFGLKDLSELPSMEEFEKMAAVELEEPEIEPMGGSDRELDLNPALEFDGSANAESENAQAPEEAMTQEANASRSQE